MTEADAERDIALSFKCPLDLAAAADRAAAKELLSRSAFARRALLRAVEAAGIELGAVA